MSRSGPLHLAVALDGAGWHPAAWRASTVPPREFFRAPYWVSQALEAEQGLLDFLTVEDAFAVQSTLPDADDDRADRFRGRFDAVQLAARIAPRTRGVGLVPAVTVTHSEPFQAATAVATLDFITAGRGGWHVRATSNPVEARNSGRWSFPLAAGGVDGPVPRPSFAELLGEAADYVEVVRRLWDSWEDDAIIRDLPSGRFLDRDRLHYIDFESEWFAVKGPSITPRPPQGQPLVTVLARSDSEYRLAVTSADVVFVTPRDQGDARDIVTAIRAAERETGRSDLKIFADLLVFLDDDAQGAADRRARWDELAGAELVSDAAIVSTSPTDLVDLLLDWRAAGLDGFRLRPGSVDDDLPVIARGVVPELQARGVFRTRYGDGTLRARLGLGRPANRYVTANYPS